MKSILLASASIVAFTIAGAAQAEVTFGGEATLGFNDDDDNNAPEDSNDGFYWDANLAVTMSQTLDNGLTIAATANWDLADDTTGLDLESGDFLVAVTSDAASLYFGDTSFAAETYWSATGDLDSDGFSEADGEVVMRGEAMFGGFTAGFSYVIADAAGDIVGDDPTVDGDLDQLSIGATGEFGAFSVGMAYQEESDTTGGSYDPVGENGDFSVDEIFGIFASTTFGAADVSFAYAQNETADTSSTGIGVSYPVGPVVLGASYAMNPDGVDNYEFTVDYVNGPIVVSAAYSNNEDDNDEEYSVDATYDVGGGLSILAGFNDGDGTADPDYYVASVLALSDAASVTASYAVDDDESEEDEIGAPEYQEGTTVEFSFQF